MTHRPFVCSLLAAGLLASMPLAAQQHGDDYASIAQLQQRMDDGSLSSKSLTPEFLARIRRIDRCGAALHSVLQTNHAWQAPRFLDTMDGKPVPAAP